MRWVVVFVCKRLELIAKVASDRYISNPPIFGTKKNDVVLATGINVSFAAQ